MKRTSVLMGFGVMLLLAALAGGAVVLLHHIPRFYEEAAVAPTKLRSKESARFASSCAQFYQDVTYNREWAHQFEQHAINSFFAEQFVSSGLAPQAFSEPRLVIEPDKMRLGFRYKLGPFKTIISIDMRVWLAANQPNAVALELQGLHAGAFPVSAQSLLEQISETARQNNVEVTWYRYQGNPVALLRFQADQDRPSFRLDHLVLRDQAIYIHGRSSDGAGYRAMLPATSPTSTH